MFAYLKTKAEFIEEMGNLGNIKFAAIINQGVVNSSGEVSTEEDKSWKNSLPVICGILKDEKIPENAGIGIEYGLPGTPYRADFMISGYDSAGKAVVIIIELKQWSKVSAVSGEDNLVCTWTGEKKQKVVHPCYQVDSYAWWICGCVQAVEDNNITIIPCVFMHNYIRQNTNDQLYEKQYEELIKNAPIFTKNEGADLKKFIEDRIVAGDNGEILNLINKSNCRTSKSLQKSFPSIMQGDQEFILLDDQRIVFDEIKGYVQEALLDNDKTKTKKLVIIVPGRPGTGKSLIAINLLAYFKSKEIECRYTSKNAAPRRYYQKELTKALRSTGTNNDAEINSLLVDSGFFTKKDAYFDVILADEAHRLGIENPSDYNCHKEVDEIKEIIKHSKCSIFFIDPYQRVSVQDVGSIGRIQREAGEIINNNEDAPFEMRLIITDEMKSQFRCNGSNGYLDWLDNTLEIRENRRPRKTYVNGINYDFQVFDSPSELFTAICKKDSENKEMCSRLVAGYCWEWDEEYRDDPNHYDIKNIQGFEDFKMSWNLAPSGYPYSYVYDKNSINQVGCVHTVQGLEFEYIGVIIGDDMQYRNGKIVTDRTKRARSDYSLEGVENDTKADELIKNTYRVLMTRGVKGCYVFCTDKALQNYLIEQSKDLFLS